MLLVERKPHDRAVFCLAFIALSVGGVVHPQKRRVFSTVFDGYISGARVFRDTNSDLSFSVGEPFFQPTLQVYFRPLGGPI